MNRVDRLLGLLLFLQSRKYVTAASISEKFGMSIRTVYRDISALNEQGVPIGFEPGKGYFVVEGYFLPPVSFTTDEANALLLVERIVKGFSDNSIRQQFESALSKVRSVLKTRQKESVAELDASIHLQLPGRLDSDFSFLSPLQQAISAKTCVEISYRSQTGDDTRRTIEPIGLVFYAFSWHLIAWCHLRQDYRDFKISRLVSIKQLGCPFLKTDHMPLSEYLKLLPVGY